MRIPKYIDKALTLRCKYALLLWKQCAIIDAFIELNDICVDSEDYLTGVEIYANPIDSETRIREAIKSKER